MASFLSFSISIHPKTYILYTLSQTQNFYFNNSIPEKYHIRIKTTAFTFPKSTHQPTDDYANHLNTMKYRYNITSTRVCIFRKGKKWGKNQPKVGKFNFFNGNEYVSYKSSHLYSKKIIYVRNVNYDERKKNINCGSLNDSILQQK